jgi:hypothetical protein
MRPWLGRLLAGGLQAAAAVAAVAAAAAAVAAAAAGRAETRSNPIQSKDRYLLL